MADSALLNAIRATPLPSHMESFGQGDPSVMIPALGKEYPTTDPATLQRWSLTNPAFDPTTDLIGSGITKPFTMALTKMAGLKATPLLAGIFMKPTAKEASSAALMEMTGADKHEIYGTTGLFRSPDKLWRKEITDHNMNIKSPLVLMKDKQRTLLEDVIDHPELQKEFPKLMKNLTIVKDNSKKIDSASLEYIDHGMFGKKHVLTVGPTSSKFAERTIMTHELQHAVQDLSGFERGGSARDYLPEDSSNSSFDDLLAAHKQYKSLMGEAEARATQNRASMDEATRKGNLPENSYDMSWNELLRK